MATDPLGCTVDNDVCTMLERLSEVTTSTKCVVHDQRHTLLMCHFGNGFKIRNVVPRVTNSLNIDGLGPVINGRGDVFGVFAIDKLCVDSQTREEDFELIVGTAVEIRS